MNRFVLILLAIFSIYAVADTGVTTSEFKDGDKIYKTISFDGRFIVYSDEGGLSYHDRSSVDPTFRIRRLEKGINYAFLSEDGAIAGYVSDLDQDGSLDLKIWNHGQIDIWLNGRWYKKNSDSEGDFVYIGSNKTYLKKGHKYGKYYISEE